jgi:hypothetical protein
MSPRCPQADAATARRSSPLCGCLTAYGGRCPQLNRVWKAGPRHLFLLDAIPQLTLADLVALDDLLGRAAVAQSSEPPGKKNPT